MKHKFIAFLPIVIFVIGLMCFLYPKISSVLYQDKMDNIIQKSTTELSEQTAKKLDIEWKKAKKYNKQDFAYKLAKEPFSNETSTYPKGYLDTLNLGKDGIIGEIRIPKLNLDIPIYHGVDDDTLQKGIGHIAETPFPIGGKGNNSVLCGHNGMPSAEMFTHLDKLKKGDKFYIYVLDKKLEYKVTSKYVVEPDSLTYVYPVPNKDLVTLVTCTPYGLNNKRLLVRAERVKSIKRDLKKEAKSMDKGWFDRVIRVVEKIIKGLF